METFSVKTVVRKGDESLRSVTSFVQATDFTDALTRFLASLSSWSHCGIIEITIRRGK